MYEFISISLLIILVAISPGPDFVLVTKNALSYSRRVGICTALGVSVSLLIHTVYCTLGLAIVISQSLLAFSLIKYLGAAYLIYIGFKGLLTKKDLQCFDANDLKPRITAIGAFYQGLLCNLLNPKAIMFLLAFFTLVVKSGNSILTEIGYGFEIALIHMIWFSFLAYMLTHCYVKNKLSSIQYYLLKFMGVVLIAFGVRIATFSQGLVLAEAA